MLKNVLLIVHIGGGSLALVSALVAIISQAVRSRHVVHVVAGRVFVVGMIMVVISAVPLALIIGSVFLGLVAVFSAYLMLSGWRFAKNRRGVVGPLDWLIPGLMSVASLAMIIFGALTLADNGAVLLIFGVVGGGLSVLHFRRLRSGPIRGRARISNHLVWMLSAFIAALTAFVVVNTNLGWIGWLLPSAVVSPIIAIWSRKTLAGRSTTLDQSRPERATG